MTSIAIQPQARPHEIRRLQIVFVVFATAAAMALLFFAAGSPTGAEQEILKSGQSGNTVECDGILPLPDGSSEGTAVYGPDPSCLLAFAVEQTPSGTSPGARPRYGLSGAMPDDPMTNTFAKIETVVWAHLV